MKLPIQNVRRGGSQALPEAMAASLSQPPVLDAQVSRIESVRGRLEVRCADGRRFRSSPVGPDQG